MKFSAIAATLALAATVLAIPIEQGGNQNAEIEQKQDVDAEIKDVWVDQYNDIWVDVYADDKSTASVKVGKVSNSANNVGSVNTNQNAQIKQKQKK
jgi:hypothetical protein